ncbi:MAG: glycoside hydrolase [Gammaproteobacteria bacterium]|nr:glycoside hydrolase [Gammaproteobacteria bacterium]
MSYEGRLWISCRQGVNASSTPHGDRGRLYLYCSAIDDLENWQRVPIIFNQVQENPNDLDAIISGPFGHHLILASRHFRAGNNVPFWSRFDIHRLAEATVGKSPIILDREPINLHLHRQGEGLTVAAMYGHVLEDEEHGLIATTYSATPGKRPSPAILCSKDRGKSWQKKSFIARSEEFGKYLNETSLISLNNRKWIAVIRTDEQPWPLYFSQCNDGLEEWSALEDTGLFGHAPTLILDRSGNPLLVYRDLSCKRPKVSMARYIDNHWEKLGELVEYENIYNGGYSDIVSLAENKYFVTTYMDDKDASPWILGMVVRLEYD